ncbi:MAG: oxidoreductase [Ferruginibacter sp.]|nr:oxidoreductase [Ferruginibacter sp.]
MSGLFLFAGFDDALRLTIYFYAMKSIPTALCSFGMSGLVFHAPFISLHHGFELYAVAERSKQKAREIYPSIKSFSSVEEMLKDDYIELVVVNTPNATHFDYAKKALMAGKHVLVEKSFTVTVEEAAELLSIAAEFQKKIIVFQNRRYDSDFRTVEQIIRSGRLGDIVDAEFHYDRYNLNLSPKQHKELPSPGAGVLHDLGPHIIDQAIYLFGMPGSLFASLRITRPSSAVADYFEILLFYPALTVRLKASYIVAGPVPSYVVNGTKGSFQKKRGDIQEDALKTGAYPQEQGWGREPESLRGILYYQQDGKNVEELIETLPGSYLDFYEAVYHSLAYDSRPPVTGEDGLHVMQVIDAAIESAQKAAVVRFSKYE